MVKKKIIVPLLLLCSMLFVVPVMASEPKVDFVYDDAELFTQSEADSISEKISDFSSETGWEIYAFTTEDAQGYTSQEYGENTFDQYATGMDGVALSLTWITVKSQWFILEKQTVIIRTKEWKVFWMKASIIWEMQSMQMPWRQ